MTVSAGSGARRLAHPDPEFDGSRSIATRGDLEHSAEVASGLTLTWDPAVPHRCVEFDDEQRTDARLAGIDRAAWLRLAAVTMLDHRLYLPLDRSLLDAEIAAAQLAAARTLSPTEPIRERLIGRALARARGASHGLVRYLERLAIEERRPPPALEVSLARLTCSYAAFSGEVREFDATLAAVDEARRRPATTARVVDRGRRKAFPPPPAESSRPGTAQIDPRLVPARVLRLGPTSDAAEISVDSVRGGDGPALRVRVDAFADAPFPEDTGDVGVRLIDRRSGQVRGYGVLGQPEAWPRPSRKDTKRHFESVISLPESVPAPDVRIDLYGAAGAPPPITADRAELRRVRRATLFLSDWRALVADVKLWGIRSAPTARLRTIACRLTAGDHVGNDATEPLWSGGPSRCHLALLAELGDRPLTALLRNATVRAATIPGDDGGAAAVVAAVSGPGDLLAAELAAAHERARRRPLR